MSHKEQSKLPLQMRNALRGTSDPFGRISQFRQTLSTSHYPALVRWFETFGFKAQAYQAGRRPRSIRFLRAEQRMLGPVELKAELAWAGAHFQHYASMLSDFVSESRLNLPRLWNGKRCDSMVSSPKTTLKRPNRTGNPLGRLPRSKLMALLLDSFAMAGAIAHRRTRPIRISPEQAATLLVDKLTSEYPILAQQARIQGTVTLDVVIGKDGAVRSLSVASGHPLLVPATIASVTQWRYKPYESSGEPSDVTTQVMVNFVLSSGPPQ